MIKDSLKFIGLRGNFLWIGVAFGLAFWMLEPLVHVAVFSKLSYIDELFGADTHETWMRAMVSCLFILFGGVVQLTIAQCRQAESALRESEKQYKTLFDSAGDAIFVHDMKGCFLDVNLVVCERYGYSREEMLSMTPADIDSPENALLMPERLQQLKKTGQICFEVLHLGRNGKPLPTEATVRLVEYAGQPAALCIGRDISERKKMEDALAQREKQMSVILSSLDTGLSLINLDMTIGWVNEKIRDMFPRADPIGQLCYSFCQGRSAPCEQCAVLETMATNQVCEKDVFNQDRKRWFRTVAQPVQDQDGNLVSVLESITDITERKLADEALLHAHADLERQVRLRTRELITANEQLQELNRQLSAFLSSASHELRTPLTSVLGFAKLVQRNFSRYFAPLAQGKTDLVDRAAVIEDNLSIIGQEGERLTRLINDLLDLNKIEAGRMEWRDLDLDARNLIQDAARRAEAGFRFKPGVRFVIALPDSLPRLRADRDRIMQVLANLLDNAAKFTEQGEVTLSAQELPGNGLEISVTDTGPGVPGQDREHIFEKFFQAGVPGPEGPKPKGTGLGLAICRQIVEHYGGTIQVEDGPGGVGANFTVQLPVRPEPQSGAAAMDSPTGRT